MGNTFFYRQVKSGGDEITWKDIFSECRRKHTRQELEYALSAGTSMNQVSEADMLKKWQKPWVFYPLLKGGLLLVFLTYLDSSMFDDLLPTLMASLSLFERFTPFVNGMFDMSAVVYYLSVIVFFLFLSVQSMEKRRHNG